LNEKRLINLIQNNDHNNPNLKNKCPIPIPFYKDINLIREIDKVNTEMNYVIQKAREREYEYATFLQNNIYDNNNSSILPYNNANYALKFTTQIKNKINEVLEQFDMMILNKYFLKGNK